MSQSKPTAYFLSIVPDLPARGYWDQGIIEDLLSDFPKREVFTLPPDDVAIVILPAKGHKEHVREVNRELNKIKSVVLFISSDEEHVFPVEEIMHPNIRIWVAYPHPNKHAKYERIGCGYPASVHKAKIVPDKSTDWAFMGQITHDRRQEMYKQFEKVSVPGFTYITKGFGQGLDPIDYYHELAQAKVVPSPSGPETPDTFRTYEALELGCVPIVDTMTPREDWKGYWDWLFGETVPFPQIRDWSDLPGYIEDVIKQYPTLNNTVQAFWMKHKNHLRRTLYRNLLELTGTHYEAPITVVIPVSPIPSHPNTDLLEETIANVRTQLPEAEIIITFDGVRKEQTSMKAKYQEHIRRVLWKSRFWGNVRPYIFDRHIHQIGMMREIIHDILSPVLLYIEQDTPIVADYEIPWKKLTKDIIDGESNLIRFHFEAFVPKEHTHLMIGKPENDLLKTVQWSQRPHLASTAFYKRIMSEHFSKKANCFIEDLMHGKVLQDWSEYGELGWNQWRMHIYHPEGNIKRSYHLDGREGSEKFDDRQTW